MTTLSAEEPRVRTLETEYPTVPEGVSASVYPLPRTEWVVNVKAMIENGQKVASATRLVLDGDSITAGWRRYWPKLFPEIPTVNFAISGDRSQHLLWRVSQGQLKGFKPQAVLLMIGTNNIGNNESVKDTVAGVKASVAAYREHCPDAVIYIHGLLPRGTGPHWKEKIQSINAELVGLEDGKQVRYLDVSKLFLNEDGSVNRERMPDQLHPNEAGYRAWAEVLRPVLESYAFGESR